MYMPYKLLDEITGGFSDEIGRGTFGVVYKGKDQAGQELAVKLLRDQITDLDGNAFEKEFNNLAKLKHPNIVRLVGFCNEEKNVLAEYHGKTIMAIQLHRALCLEYLHNGSLQKHLSDEHQGLDWQKRYIIIKGICMGLNYLHTGLESPVNHLDLKPDNILLDDNMVPKIADFGLSRLLFGEETSRKTLSALGTLGYCPPEFMNQQIISKAFDIFSLGVIIIKIICGPAAHSPGDDQTKTQKFIRQVHRKWRERLRRVPRYTPLDVEWQCKQLKMCIEIALNCTIKDRQRRPTIGYIIDQLTETEKANSIHIMPYKLLDEITGGFSDEIGRGTFGVVYKGKDKARKKIAVKVLDGQFTDLDGNAFRKEFDNLSKLEHPNIVRLVGFCDEGEEVLTEHEGKQILVIRLHRALCFEYLNNGSLEKHLSDEQEGFNWQERYIIIKGICMGLNYLHTGLESPVHHFDLKPDNVLLDNNMVPKIADFGLSRLLGQETSKKTLSALGTLGYCPPEFMKHQIISKEFDIFSLGVIILRIICGREAHSPDDDKTRKFIRLVEKKWKERLRGISGYTSVDVECQCKQVKKCIEIALNCTITERQRRPTIGHIIDQLAEIEKHINDKSKFNEREPAESSPLPTNLPMTLMKEITRDFSAERELGRSVFGTVYQGVLPEGGRMIAVKRLVENAPVPSDITFETEVTNLMSLKHENIVELIHYCYESQKKVVERNGRYMNVDDIEICLCYRYVPKGSLDNYIYADTTSINWDTRYKIIKGICQGLHFLHKELDGGPLIHMNLVPNSVWLDDNWVPKIDDFGLSRLFGKEQTLMYTVKVKGHIGYIAPEYLYRGEISTMSDIYSLGMIILEITTRERNYPDSEDRSARLFVDTMHQNWKTDEQIMYNYPSLDPDGLQQVRACIEIGLKCVDADRRKRPSIVDIVNRLNGKRVPIFEQIRADSLSPDEITPTSTMQLDIHPRQLRFSIKPDKSFSCPVRLINRTEDYVAARLLTDNPKRYVAATLLCGVVPPRSTYTLVVTMKGHDQLLADEVLSLESCVLPNIKDVNIENADLHSVGITLFKNTFKEAKGLGADNVHENKVKVVFDLPKEATYDQPFKDEIEIISNKKFSQVLCVEVHPVEPWIMTSHQGGDIFIWDYQEQKIESSFDFTQRAVSSVKFIIQEECLVAGDGDGIIYVYNYYTDEKVTIIEAHEGNITSLVLHPTDPLALSSSDDHLIKIWDWEKGWECIRTLEGHSDTVMQVVFNPVDTDSLASASLDQTIKIWNISSSECKKTLSDHLVGLPRVLTYNGDNGQCLVTGSSDGTTQIWDLETETCVQTLEGHTDRISCVYRHPELPILLTGSHDGTVRAWNSDTFSLEDIFGIKLGAVFAFGYIKSVERVVVACHQGIAIMEMK